MNKESFNWKSLFINEENGKVKNEENNPTSSPETTKFPEVDLNSQTTANYTNPFLSEILEVYQKGFESLNSSGFDFYELYKSVNAVGVNNPQSYQMAFTMGKTINPELTKQFLQEKATYYISEIEKVFSKYESTGSGKKTELNNKITQEKNNLTASISDLESKIAQLQKELEKKKNDLAKLDHDNAAEFSEIQLKMEANAIAKQKILESINIVVTGINQYL
jgi:uncharacterized small protein (DUF1192 family)